MGKKEDRRVIRTKKAIRSAFAVLASQKDYNDITVTDIAETANINRKTFYNYYHNTEELLEDIENEAVANFDDLISDIKMNRLMETPELIMKRISATLENDIDYYRDVLMLSRNAALFNRIAERLHQQMLDLLKTQSTTLDPLVADVLSIFVMSGSLSVYRVWMEHGDPSDKKTIEDMLALLMLACIQAMMAS
jgi:AcrR family transcriptional regulator